jgi:hypothetical protein
MAVAGSTRNAARMARVLASAQMIMTAMKPLMASPDSSSTYFGKAGAQKGGRDFADYETDQPQAQRLLQDHPGDGAELRVPISLSTAISRILPSVMV